MADRLDTVHDVTFCEFRDCFDDASARLFFGRFGDIAGEKAGRLCPGVNYCDHHAQVVRGRFTVEKESDPAGEWRGSGQACRRLTRRGVPCQRARIPGEDTCPSHRDRVAAAA